MHLEYYRSEAHLLQRRTFTEPIVKVPYGRIKSVRKFAIEEDAKSGKKLPNRLAGVDDPAALYRFMVEVRLKDGAGIQELRQKGAYSSVKTKKAAKNHNSGLSKVNSIVHSRNFSNTGAIKLPTLAGAGDDVSEFSPRHDLVEGAPIVAKHVFRGGFLKHDKREGQAGQREQGAGHGWKQRYGQWLDMEHRLVIACTEKAQQSKILKILRKNIAD